MGVTEAQGEDLRKKAEMEKELEAAPDSRCSEV